MCTVSLIPLDFECFVLTSNRDESPNRATLQPNFYEADNAKVLFPKDKIQGGTWIGVSTKKRALCLLNGGFTNHKRVLPYKKSRGLIVKEFLGMDNLLSEIEIYDFDNIEPFTLVIVEWSSNLKFYEFVWDGIKKHLKNLDLKPHIWSSSTLYNLNMKQERLQWFKEFVSSNKLNNNSILRFHKNKKKDNVYYGVVMNRNVVKTTSITQIIKDKDCVKMHFEDLQHNSESLIQFNGI